jgi:O-antigen/teichoic acid export membrane protein
LGVGTIATTLGLVAQVSLITHELGLREYGVFSLVVAVVAMVNRLVDLNPGAAVISFGARELASNSRRASGVVQFSYLFDAGSGVVGFCVLAALAPLAGDALIGQGQEHLLLIYGLTLLLSTIDGTSLAVLKLLDCFGHVAGYVVASEMLRVVAITVALTTFGSLESVVAALAVHAGLMGLIALLLATAVFRRETGRSLRVPAFDSVRDVRRPMLKMIFHTNLVTSGSIVQAQVPILLLGAVRGPLEVGIFKAGWTGAQVLGLLGAPASTAYQPRAARLWAESRIAELRRLTKESTIVAVTAAVVLGGALILARDPLLSLFASTQATAAASVFAVAVVSQAVNVGFFWNGAFLFAIGSAARAARIYLLSLAALAVLLAVLVPLAGAEGAAVALLCSTVLVNGGMTAASIRLLRGKRSPLVG